MVMDLSLARKNSVLSSTFHVASALVMSFTSMGGAYIKVRIIRS